MCGFFLNFSSTENYNLKENILKFNKTKHRGVDNSEFIEINRYGKIFLGHHRLSINDLSKKANQPLKSKCENYIILFNGEIYNFKELSKNISDISNPNSDTNVILEGYIQYGLNFFKKLEGFFSIVLLDLIEDKIIITCDPTSYKSIYYKQSKNNFSLASELSSITTSKNEILKNICKIGLQIYFQYGYIHAPYTILKKVYKSEPGELIVYDLKSKKISNIKKYNQHKYMKQDKNFKKLLIDSHSSRLVSDVPLSSMLSSGVDSTLSNIIYSKILKKKMEVFTLGLSDEDFDESEKAIQQTVDLNLSHKVLKFDKKEIIEEYIRVTKYLDEPFADSSSVLVSLLSKEISKKFKVTISSDGGDELLYGYSRHKFFYFFRWIYLIPAWIKKLLYKILNSNFFANYAHKKNYEIKLNKILSFLESSKKELAYLNLLKIIPDRITKKILKGYKKDNLINFVDLSSSRNFIKDIDYNYYLPSINYKNDRCGMQHSLEIREPLMNFNLVRGLYNKKLNFIDILKSKNNFRKILKEHNIKLSTNKKGFSFSQSKILEFQNYYLLEKINNNFKFLSHFFELKIIKKMIIEFKENKRFSQELWVILTFTLWLDNKVNE
jgi:asparagine synthase (glutamine-hydrolysing)